MKQDIIKRPKSSDLKYWIKGCFLISRYTNDLEKYVKYLEKQIVKYEKTRTN